MLDVAAWSGVRLLEPVDEGNRNEVWRAERDGELLAVRTSRRSEASLTWELALIDALHHRGFLVPIVVETTDGRLRDGSTVVQRWIEGSAPSSDHDWSLVAAELQRLHAATTDDEQRPGCASVGELAVSRRSVDVDLDQIPAAVLQLVEPVFREFADAPIAVIHGDPGSSNIRITPDGHVGLLDWDESRVDVTWHDLSELGVQVLPDHDQRRAQLLSDAWETVNAWVSEPEYAAARLRRLETRLSRG